MTKCGVSHQMSFVVYVIVTFYWQKPPQEHFEEKNILWRSILAILAPSAIQDLHWRGTVPAFYTYFLQNTLQSIVF